MTVGKVIAVKYKKNNGHCLYITSKQLSNKQPSDQISFSTYAKNSLGNKPKKKGMKNYPWRE